MQKFLAGTPLPRQAHNQAETIIDLAMGLDEAEQALDRARPDQASLYYREKFIGCMPAEPGAERWRGAHLRPYLIEHCRFHLVEAYAAQGLIGLAMSRDEIATLVEKEAQDRSRRGYVYE